MDYMLKKVLPQTEDEREGWQIQDDATADWAAQKVQAKHKEYQRLRDALTEQLAQIQHELDTLDQQEEIDHDIQFFTDKLYEYFQTVQRHVTKTQESYKLLGGRKLLLKYPQPKISRDPDLLLPYLKDHAEIFVETTVVERVKWKELKQDTEIIENEVYYQGTPLPGIEVKYRPWQFKVTE